MLERQKKTFLLIELLYLLIPISLVFSIALADFFLSIIVIFFIIYSAKYKIFQYYRNKLFIFFISFCLYLILISLIKNKEVPLSVLFFFRFGFFSIATWFLLDRNKNLLKNILSSIFISCLIVVLDAFIQLIFGTNILGYEYNFDLQPRLSGFFNDELILGSYLSRLSPIVFLNLGLFLNRPKKLTLSFLFFITFLFIYISVVLASGERLSLIYLLLSLIMFMVILKSLKIASIILICFLVSFFLISSDSNSRLIKTTILQLEGSFTTQKDGEISLKNFSNIPIGHIHHWKSSLLMAKNNIIFGVGPKKFRIECKNPKYNVPNGCANHPHSLYFQLLGETGIVGFSFFIIFFVFIISKLVLGLNGDKSFSLDNKIIISNFALFCLFLHYFPFLPNGSFFNNWLNIITFIPMGIYLHASYNIKNV